MVSACPSDGCHVEYPAAVFQTHANLPPDAIILFMKLRASHIQNDVHTTDSRTIQPSASKVCRFHQACQKTCFISTQNSPSPTCRRSTCFTMAIHQQQLTAVNPSCRPLNRSRLFPSISNKTAHARLEFADICLKTRQFLVCH